MQPSHPVAMRGSSSTTRPGASDAQDITALPIDLPMSQNGSARMQSSSITGESQKDHASFKPSSLSTRHRNMKNLSLSSSAPRIHTSSLSSSSTASHLSRSSPASPRFSRLGSSAGGSGQMTARGNGPKLPALDTSFHKLRLNKTGSMPMLNNMMEVPATPRDTATFTDATGDLDSQLQSADDRITTTTLTRPHDVEIELDYYKEGPVCIQAPNLWLYSAPTIAEAQKFDVVINVAHEIVNPFETDEGFCRDEGCDCRRHAASTTAGAPSHAGSRKTSAGAEPQFGCELSPSVSDTAATASPSTLSTPATSRSGSVDVGSMIEYVHVPWQHNQPLAPELPALVELMRDRIERRNRKVLVHCQQGISRSASLVIAYIMAVNKMGLHQAYAYVKDRSHGVGPNMSLIYQLCEWQAVIEKDSPPVSAIAMRSAAPVSRGVRQQKHALTTGLESVSPKAGSQMDASQEYDAVVDDDDDERHPPSAGFSEASTVFLLPRLPSEYTYTRYHERILPS
ncbi:tyrosine/serine/threonine protein phosphatase [Savitreella phatthalungensis]